MMEMMALLSCFKDTTFNEAKCAGQMRALHDCVSKKVRDEHLHSELTNARRSIHLATNS